MLSGKENDMKTFIGLALAGLLLFSCSKNDSDNGPAITGTWELRQSVGGIAGTIDYAPGNGFGIVFYANSTYKVTVPPNVNSIEQSGPYEIKTSAKPGDWLLKRQYVLNGQTLTQNDSVRFDKKNLVFLPSASCCDIPTISYEKTGH